MLPFDISPATVILGLVLIGLVVLAVRRIRRKGSCDCNEANCSHEACSSCGAVDKMVADMNEAAQKK